MKKNPAAQPALKATMQKDRRQRNIFIAVTVVPSLVLFLLLVIVPVFNMFYTSLLKWDGYIDSEKIFQGLENYKVLFGKAEFGPR